MQKNIPVDIADIESAVSISDLALVKRIAHRMKSTIQYSDYIDLSELLSGFETKGDTPTAISELKVLIPQLKELAGHLMYIIEEEKKKIG
jgi:hypothetical protein